MKVLSLFDWISCWKVALDRAWITVEQYYASEVDKYAIEVSQNNHSDIIRLWDVNKWNEWNLEWIDMIIWWSPCQWFSNAGKWLNFDDPRSKLFFVMVDIIKYYKPKYFLLENVKMKKEWVNTITEQLFWIQPIEINSALVSAQSRKRLYWFGELQEDWTYKTVDVSIPNDKWIFLRDILEKDVDAKYYLSQDRIEKMSKWKSSQKPLENIKSYKDKSQTITARWAWENHSWMVLVKIVQPPRWFNRLLEFYDKSPTLSSHSWQQNNFLYEWNFIRTITPIECERLQTLPDDYTKWVSNRQRYKTLWNWWTVDVISHILSHIRK